MAFKMKGNPAKMGKIQGTSGHTSALKHSGADYEKEIGEKAVKAYKDAGGSYAKDHNKGHKTEFDEKHNDRKKEQEKPTKEGEPKMKSPLEQEVTTQRGKGKFIKRVPKKSTNIDELMDTATKFKGKKTLTPKKQTKSMKKTLEDIKPGMRRDIVPNKRQKMEVGKKRKEAVKAAGKAAKKAVRKAASTKEEKFHKELKPNKFNEKFDKALKKSGGKMPSNSYQVSR